LKLQFLELWKLVEQPQEEVEFHECRRTMWWAILAKLDGAHPTAQVALPDNLYLEEPGQIHGNDLPRKWTAIKGRRRET
jgi:hypothetical protein